jgi:hypothetical protein
MKPLRNSWGPSVRAKPVDGDGYITEDIMIGIASRGFNMPVVDLSKRSSRREPWP